MVILSIWKDRNFTLFCKKPIIFRLFQYGNVFDSNLVNLRQNDFTIILADIRNIIYLIIPGYDSIYRIRKGVQTRRYRSSFIRRSCPNPSFAVIVNRNHKTALQAIFDRLFVLPTQSISRHMLSKRISQCILSVIL